MRPPSISEIERALFPFRKVRRLVLIRLLERLAQEKGIQQPLLTISRLFCRLKSADSVLEKIQRKNIAVDDASEIPGRITDLLGFRIIAENIHELQLIDRFLTEEFEVKTRHDKVKRPGEFGDRGIEYKLRYNDDDVACPFEVQLRTFLQHYWSSQTFHLFHKKSREIALQHRDALVRLSEALENVENTAREIHHTAPHSDVSTSPEWKAFPLYNKIHLIVVQPGEKFVTHVEHSLSGNDERDHTTIVGRKLDLYTTYSDCAIVECSCMSFFSFMLNEPHVWVPVSRLKELAF